MLFFQSACFQASSPHVASRCCVSVDICAKCNVFQLCSGPVLGHVDSPLGFKMKQFANCLVVCLHFIGGRLLVVCVCVCVWVCVGVWRFVCGGVVCLRCLCVGVVLCVCERLESSPLGGKMILVYVRLALCLHVFGGPRVRYVASCFACGRELCVCARGREFALYFVDRRLVLTCPQPVFYFSFRRFVLN